MSSLGTSDRLIRMYCESPLPTSEEWDLSETTSHYVSRVLRLKKGVHLHLFDSQGYETSVELLSVERGSVLRVRRLEGNRKSERTSSLRIHLLCGLSKGKKLDDVIRRVSELGGADLRPLVTHRSVPSGEGSDTKCARWSRIAGEAARQCGRIPMKVLPIASLREGLVPIEESSIGFVLWEEEGDQSFTALCKNREAPEHVYVLMGPEGGLSAEEVEWARSLGYISASLGPRILRAETAPLAALTILQSIWGDMV